MARMWNFPKETFQEYAVDKLDIMHNLGFPERDKINYLVNGIKNTAIKSAASILQLDDN